MHTIFKKMKKMTIRAIEMSQLTSRVSQKEAIRKMMRMMVFLILQRLKFFSMTRYPAVMS